MGRRKARQVFLGDKRVERIFLGETELWGHYVYVTQNFEGLTSNAPEKMLYGKPLTVVFTPESGKQLIPSTIVVTMGGNDVTESVYNPETNQIEIPSVTNDVTITAVAETIPSAYKPVRCIQCYSNADGKQFALGYSPTNLTEIIADVNILELFNYLGVFGTNTGSTPYFALMARYTGSYGRGWWGNSVLEASAFGPYLKINGRQTITMGKGSLTYLQNNNDYRTVTFNSTVTTPWTAATEIQLGGYKVGSQTFRWANIRIYEFQIKEDDTLVRRYIPCYRISDNVVGLYDIVNDSFLLQRNGGSDWTPYSRASVLLNLSSPNTINNNENEEEEEI